MQIPPQLMTNDRKSFAYYTVTQRFPGIIRSVLENNIFDSKTKSRFEFILKSIPDSSLEPLPATSQVNRRINGEIKKNQYKWNNVPFIFVENYLYHLLIEVTGYRHNKTDFFAYKKDNDVLQKTGDLSKIISNIDNIINEEFSESLKKILPMNLFGNTADLSHMNLQASGNIPLLIDHSGKSSEVFSKAKRIDMVLDNSGEELFYDLLLVYWILKKTQTKKVYLHFKAMPYFVSDALIKDCFFLLDELSKADKNKWFTGAMSDFIKSGQLVLCENTFWNDTDTYHNMPKKIKKLLAPSDLIIFKGDLNYRKLVEDRAWNYTVKTSDITNYMPNNLLIIRVLKSEIVTGLSEEDIPRAGNNEWMYNSKYGVIELVLNGRDKI